MSNNSSTRRRSAPTWPWKKKFSISSGRRPSNRISNQRYLIAPAKGTAGIRIEQGGVPRPDPGQALIRMRAWSLNFRDLMMIDGTYPVGDLREIVPLSDGAGEILELGAGCTRFVVGDRVCPIFMQSFIGGDMTDADLGSALGGAIDGVLADYVVLDERGLVRIPAHMDFGEAATLPCAAVTAWNALYAREPINSGSTVLALGTGGVAIWTLQLARAAGAEVIITSSSDAKLASAVDLGADHGINYVTNAQWGVAARALTAGRGVDKIVDSAGSAAFGQNLAALRRCGEIAMVGVLSLGQIDPVGILIGGALVRGIMVGSRQEFEALVRTLEHHQIRPVIDRRFTFAEAGAAFDHLLSGSHFGKVVIEAA